MHRYPELQNDHDSYLTPAILADMKVRFFLPNGGIATGGPAPPRQQPAGDGGRFGWRHRAGDADQALSLNRLVIG
jgi:hypothetical protein